MGKGTSKILKNTVYCCFNRVIIDSSVIIIDIIVRLGSQKNDTQINKWEAM